MKPEYKIIGDECCRRVDYAIKETENLLCITEDKVQRSILEGFAQNIKQLESSQFFSVYKRKQMEKGKQKINNPMIIVTSARNWHFLLYSLGEISQASEVSVTIEFNKKALNKESEEYQTLRNGVKKIDSLREINLKFLAKITELKKENAEVKAENVKLKHALEEHI
ncbi:hypothetical protein RhiirA4_517176 [Rhizophagus irregularis]|uniref:Uncharacterized protein n=1 Tax=Rhizophagus irregularis TaxID=588596 RepID=A0A2I1HMF5_9GLOM|nr:hypothetical protein RhiirA4_517176 [Rhizophagus irregularis]